MIETSCHCGAVRIEVARAPETLTDCNCSLCRRSGGLWGYFHPDEVAFAAGAGTTVGYVQGGGYLASHHCPTCGNLTHWQSTEKGNPERMGVNFRLVSDPRAIDGIRVRRLDGADTWEFLD